MYTIIISNPACGAGNGHDFVLNTVVPLLKEKNVAIDEIVVTEGPDHAGSVLRAARRHHSGPVQVILSSGDGTLHEVVNALLDDKESFTPDINDGEKPRWRSYAGGFVGSV